MTAPILFPSPSPTLADGLERLEAVLDEVQPLKARHRDVLPGGIRRLSDWLTTARDDLPRDYLDRPENLSAYLRFFLPWNVYRQGRLLQGLALDLAPDSRIVDLGSGPLTFALALWLASPHLQGRRLEYVGLDRSGPALRTGRALFRKLAPASEWSVRTERGVAGSVRMPPADLLVMANVLNEIEPERARREQDEQPFGRLLDRWRGACGPEGSVLLIEPGTRPAARRLSALRHAALQRDWSVVAPCPHEGDCPQPGLGRGPWCHFTFAPDGSPPWLRDLSARARLPKDRASLSFLLLRPRDAGGETAGGPSADLTRVVSEPFALPGGGSGRYACSARGLVLLASERGPRAGGPAPGEAITVTWPQRPRRDAKSGALVVPATAKGTPRR